MSHLTSNQEWESYLDNHVLKRAADGLGLEKVAARLQKLLLYEKGSFFKPHKDSETGPGMVGTLVVSLPSRLKCGEVHLSIRSEKRTLATDTAPVWDLTTLAWFSDVTHEVAELEDGYRLVLTYKLIQTLELNQSAEFFHQQVERLRAILMMRDSTQPLYYPLDHLYSKAVWPLSVAKMKGRDHAVCQLLHDACIDSGMLVLIAHMTHIEYHDDDYGKSDEVTTLERVYTCDGTRLISGLIVDKKDFLRQDAFEGEPTSETFGGYRVGYYHCQGNSQYKYTVAMLTPWQSLGKIAPSMRTPGELVFVVSLADRKFRNHRDLTLELAAASICECAVNDRWKKVRPTQTTFRIILHWALEMNSSGLYQQEISCGLKWIESQGPVVAILGQHVQSSLAQSVEWETWLGHFAENSSLAAWQRIVEQFPDHIHSSDLQHSFKAWGQARTD
ncbi:hypothetical protein GE09DRAFT_1288098, partial [Coniochaeta sp. 2T2.1]